MLTVGLPVWAAAVIVNLLFCGLAAWFVLRARRERDVPVPRHLFWLTLLALVPWSLHALAELPGACLALVALMLLPTTTEALATTRPLRLVAAGLLFGLAALFRPFYVALACVPAACFAASRNGGGRRRPRHAAALLGGLAVVVAPWLTRNALVLRDFPVLTTHSAVTFAVCNCAETPAEQGLYDKHLFAELMHEVPDEVERYHECLRRGCSNLAARPVAFVRSLPTRWRGLYQESVTIGADLAGDGSSSLPYSAVFLPFAVLGYAAFWAVWLRLASDRRALRERLLATGYLPWRELSLLVGHVLLTFGWCWGRLSLILVPYVVALLLEPAQTERDAITTSEPS